MLSFTLTFKAIQIAELLKCMLCHTGDLGSRLDTLDDIDTEKTVHQCGLFCLLGRDQKIEMKLGCENIMSQNTIVQRIGLIESLTF